MPSNNQLESASVLSTTQSGEIARLLAAGKAKQAVELAKQQHKQFNTAETERQLVDAYVARIEEFQSRGMAIEARNLLEVVTERFPCARGVLARSRTRIAMAEGKLDQVLAPLLSEQTSAEEKQFIDDLIRRQLVDLPCLAQCRALPETHSLRVAASATCNAFEAVTSGPVEDEQIALPMVSHRSPLAGWKLLIRAIAAFYRHDDEIARKALDAISPDAAVQRLARTLRGLLDGKPEKAGQAGVLASRVISTTRNLQTALRDIDDALDAHDSAMLKKGIRQAVAQCAVVRPEFLEHLKQHISVTCHAHGGPVEDVVSVMGPSRKDARFWRLLARASEICDPPPIIALNWERFLRHAVSEKMFTADTREAAVVWLRIATAISNEEPNRLDFFRQRLRGSSVVSSYYEKQAPEIGALRPPSEDKLLAEVLDAGAAFARSAKLAARAETFRAWWEWARRWQPVKQQEDVALRWHEAMPGDAEPLVILTDLAETRKAFKLAITRLDKAEAIDPLNPRVRQARLRLTFATAWRHFADRKEQLVEKDLELLGALPSMREGDRRGVLKMMRSAWHLMRNEEALAVDCADSAAKEIGPILCPIVCRAIMKTAKVNSEPLFAIMPLPRQVNPLELAQAVARGIRLMRELELDLRAPDCWDEPIDKALLERPCGLSAADLLDLAVGASSRSAMKQAYLATSAGLLRSHDPGMMAQLLLIRAKSFNTFWGRPRMIQCLRAALGMAKSGGNEELCQRIIAEIDRTDLTGGMMGVSHGKHLLHTEAVNAIVASERKAEAYPMNRSEADSFLIDAGRSSFERDDSPEDLGPFGGFVDDDEDQDANLELFDGAEDLNGLDEKSFYDLIFKGLPAPFRAQIMDAIKRSGLTPDKIQRNPRKLLEAVAAGASMSVEELNAAAGMNSPTPFDSFFEPNPNPGKKRHKKHGRR